MACHATDGRSPRSPSQSPSHHDSHQTHFDDADDVYHILERAATLDCETAAERHTREPISYTRTRTSIASVASRPPDFELILEHNDAENPKNWPFWYRCWCIAVISFATWVATLYSTSFTASTPGLVVDFNSTSTVVTLGMTTYLFGLAAGSLFVAPLSEIYGRRIVYLVCLAIWALLIVPCGLARSLTTIIVVRFFGAFFGAVMISNAPGSIVDLSNPEYLARSMSLFCIAPLNGPVTGPIIGGFVFQTMGWRWANWMVLVIAAFTFVLMLTVKETYPPTILKHKAARQRRQTQDPRWWCQYDQRVSTLHLLRVNLCRPLVLFITEPILWFMNIWISTVYGILYLCFVAYPVVFSESRGWGPGVSGLAFSGIGIGILIAIFAEPLLRRLINAQRRDPDTGRVPAEAQALVMAMGAVSTALGQLGFAWTCLPQTIHWAIPIAFGIPFGFGNTLSFIYSSNYLAGAYGIYSASALVGNAVIRSIIGGTLPLAGPSMYRALTPQWAGTLLGLLEVITIPIPLVFWRYGARIRARSTIIRQLREDQEKMEVKQTSHRNRMATSQSIDRSAITEKSTTDHNIHHPQPAFSMSPV
ncbi:hypothetical protein CDD82_5626 [Ophiocordyceps australis]|uniref:Major facilitator superfamily (MFS) profile domain-containing protein n=1 Tax=Ophiocordyceps australis TaxID=1399860 RepID=A0A2C5Z0K7_9HYPO|nr:hypothetical protein CDD82_5626 [Ophiocordyceps australis]